MQRFYVNVCRPVFFLLCASVSIVVSLTIVLSDFLLIDSTLVAYSPLYQIMSLAKKHKLEYLAVFFIYYIHIVYLIYGLMDTRLFVTFFKLTDKHGTDAKSVMFFVNRLTSMVFCLSWNIASVLQISQNTAFYLGIGQMQRIPVFGLDLLNYLPVVVFVVFIFFACRLQKVLKCMFKK